MDPSAPVPSSEVSVDFMMDAQQDQWLSLGQASALLNVHSSTLRRWADGGLVPHQRTPGGHRRFSRRALMPLLDGSVLPAAADESVDLDVAWAPRWGDNGQSTALRESWQRLGGVAAHYLLRTDSDEQLVTDAFGIGAEIAQQTRAAGGDLVYAVTDYLHFRATMLPMALASTGGDGHGALGDVPRFDRIVGEALLAIVEAFPDGTGQ
jgi:excisionase family DNA binding protein